MTTEPRVQIKSDGLGASTVVLIDGKSMDNILAVTWHMDSLGYTKAVVTFENVALDSETAEGDAVYISPTATA